MGVKKFKVLVVEDNIVNLKLLSKIVKRAGYNVLSAENGKSAYKLVKQNRPDVILLDIMMPVMDGYETCSKLKNNKNTANIPIIFISAKSEVEDKVKGFELGAVDYITKPFDSVEIIARLKTHLRLQTLRNKLVKKNKQLKNANVLLREKSEIITKDIAAAGKIQRQLLPKNISENKLYNISWKFVPSSFIAGDIFNVIPIDDKHLAIYIIDVSGHGVQAAMMAVLVHNFFRLGTDNRPIKEKIGKQLTIKNLLNPEQVAARLNIYFQMEIYDAYFTCIYGVLNTETFQFTYINAGHPYPIVLHSDKKIELLNKSDIPIGILSSTEYMATTYQLIPGDKLVFYTDGLYEFKTKDGSHLNQNQVAIVLNQAKGGLSNKFDFIVEKMLDIAISDEFEDDVSLFGIEIN